MSRSSTWAPPGLLECRSASDLDTTGHFVAWSGFALLVRRQTLRSSGLCLATWLGFANHLRWLLRRQGSLRSQLQASLGWGDFVTANCIARHSHSIHSMDVLTGFALTSISSDRVVIPRRISRFTRCRGFFTVTSINSVILPSLIPVPVAKPRHLAKREICSFYGELENEVF